MRLLQSWRPLLRIAWRDARRARGRSVLVLVMIALPVLAVTAADVAIRTASINGGEALERRIGAADAAVAVTPGQTEIVQAFDPATFDAGQYDEAAGVPTLDDLGAALGRPVPGIERRSAEVRFRTDEGVGDAEVTEVDLRDPLAAGLFELTAGRWPRRAGEVVVNADLAARGPSVGERLELPDGPTLDVVGTAESTTVRGFPIAAGPPGAFALDEQTSGLDYLIGGGAVTWADVRALNGLGALVTSRAVLTDPPPDSALPPELRGTTGGLDSQTVAVLALIVSMALLEVVLLAGPAFAVTARRQARTIALMVASGGTPAQARRLVLGTGVVLGALAAVAGVVLGIGVGWAVLPVLQRYSTTFLGPFEVPWLHLLGVAGFGVVSAVLAAIVPAWIAARQDVVAVLAGRRGDRAPSLRSPALGLVLLGVGIAAAAYGATTTGSELAIAASAVVAVLGMLLLVPLVLVGLARASGRLPLTARYAVRDAARHRTRTVPAVAAVAATVAGVVTLGIGGSSDQAQGKADYRPSLNEGVGAVYGDPEADWASYRRAVSDVLPDAEVSEVRGPALVDDSGAGTYDVVRVAVPDRPDRVLPTFGGMLGDVVVRDGSLPPGMTTLPDDRRAEAEAMLARGGVVVFADRAPRAEAATVLVEAFDNESGEEVGQREVTVPALWVEAPDAYNGPQAVAPRAVADEVGIELSTAALVVTGTDISETDETDVQERLSAVGPFAAFYVERGWRADEEWLIALLVLAALAGVLTLGGTLTATFLGLSDARPDLATLSAVGASPGTRRGVAAWFALVVGFVGAVLGATVGFIPGVAITYPLTAGVAAGPDQSGHVLDVPWLLVGGLVVVLPLLTALVVFVTARARLPLVARLD